MREAEARGSLLTTMYRNEAAWCYLEGFGGKKDKVSKTTLRSAS